MACKKGIRQDIEHTKKTNYVRRHFPRRAKRPGCCPVCQATIATARIGVRNIEKSGLFFLRSDTDKEWDVPIDVQSLKSVYEQFRTMHVDDTLDHSFLIEASVAHRATRDVHIEERLTKRERLLNALKRLIALREEMDYLEQETRTRRP